MARQTSTNSITILVAVSLIVATLLPETHGAPADSQDCKQAGSPCYEGSMKYHIYKDCCGENYVCDYSKPNGKYPGTCSRKTSDYVHLTWKPPTRNY